MKEFIAFILPPATALVGMRLSSLVLGKSLRTEFDFGFRFFLGLGVGMLVFTQAVLAGALAGINASGFLGWLAIVWGGVELAFLAWKLPSVLKTLKFEPKHAWLLLLLPLFYSWWVFGRLSTLEGTLEFDANAFWVFKSKILYLEQGKNLIHVLHQSNLGYAHMDYPMLVPCLYTLGYGVVGGVDEFVNKVWPFWMMVALAVGIFSLARLFRNPRPLPIAAVTLVAFLPASLEYIRNEGGTIPMVFYVTLAAILLVNSISGDKALTPAASILAFAGCFSTKLEGAVFAAICFCVMLPIGLKRGWLKTRILWRSAVASAICLLPYVFYRLAKPVLHPQSEWWRNGLAAPLSTLHCFPQVLFMNIGARFFSGNFFHWQADHGHLHWIGHWAGLSALANEQLSILPWLLLVVLAFSLVCKSRRRFVVSTLSAVILGVFFVLSFVIACLSEMHKDLSHVINFGCNTVGRYYYPFFVAWFLGIMTVWFDSRNAPGTKQIEVEGKNRSAPDRFEKQRR